MKTWLKIFTTAGKNWTGDNAFTHSAAVSFYTMFSMAPIMIISLAVAGFFFGKDAAKEQVGAQLTQLVGKEAAEAVQQSVTSNQIHSTGWVSAVIGVVILLIGATTVFGQMQDSLNQIWGVMGEPSQNGFIVLLVQRLLSFTMVVTIGFLLLVSLALTTGLTAFIKYIAGGVASSLLPVADFVAGLAIVTVLFALMFKILPDVKLRWADVWRGALVTAFLFSLGRFGIALYLSHTAVASAYGAAGSLVALLVWVYYSSAILFFGAEFTRATVTVHGKKVIPKEHAVRVQRQIIK